MNFFSLALFLIYATGGNISYYYKLLTCFNIYMGGPQDKTLLTTTVSEFTVVKSLFSGVAKFNPL